MWQGVKNQYHLITAILANIAHGFPGKKLTVIGVTGTDGKTTTVNLIYHILRSANFPVSMVSTVGATIHGDSSPLDFHVTNPSSFPLQKFLKQAALGGKSKKGKNYLVLEVTSHGLDQNRTWGVPFEVGVITNITPEHTDYHKNYNNYLKTKVKLLKMSKISIINKDDSSYEKILQHIPGKKIITYSLNNPSSMKPKDFTRESSLIGTFNKYNILAAVAVCKELNISDSQIKSAIKSFTTPLGRMNKIPNNRGLNIYVDYAHTANGLIEAISALKTKTKGKFISLIGAEGYRDENKRSVMGETASRMSDYVVITAVDPRGLIVQINKQILEGAKKAGGVLNKNVFIENDRRKAIDFAINELGRSGDTIGIFGKGHERSMNIDGKHEVSWSDFEAVEEALNKESTV